MRAVAVGLALSLLAGFASAQSLQLTAADGSQRTLSAAALAQMPHEDVTLNDHGKAVTFRGVPVRALATSLGAPEGEALKGPALATVILVTASDGYRVVLGLAEIDPGTGARRAILADSVSGAPLDAHQGPFRLVVDGDKRPARSARNVVSVAIKTVN
jgi:hypothetical protein